MIEDGVEGSAEQRPGECELGEGSQRDPPASGEVHAVGSHRRRRERRGGGSDGGHDECRAPQRRGGCGWQWLSTWLGSFRLMGAPDAPSHLRYER